MKKQILFAVAALISLSGMAQEPVKYRITYDCDAQSVTGKPNTYRWALDIDEKMLCFTDGFILSTGNTKPSAWCHTRHTEPSFNTIFCLVISCHTPQIVIRSVQNGGTLRRMETFFGGINRILYGAISSVPSFHLLYIYRGMKFRW